MDSSVEDLPRHPIESGGTEHQNALSVVYSSYTAVVV